ncbi:hypothetical protein BTJ44_00002 [Bacillus mycoides]|nr:hypothetical protein BTJ44_00002 [Bacillus mycoides]
MGSTTTSMMMVPCKNQPGKVILIPMLREWLLKKAGKK